MGGIWCVAARTRRRLGLGGDARWNVKTSPSPTKPCKRPRRAPPPIEIFDLDEEDDPSTDPSPLEDEEISILGSEKSENVPEDRSFRIGSSIAARTRSKKFFLEKNAVDYTEFFEEKCDLDQEEKKFGENMDKWGGKRSYRKRKKDWEAEDDPLLRRILEIRNQDLPSVFSFGDDDVAQSERSEHEKWMDGLWEEFELVGSSNYADFFSEFEEEKGSECSGCKNGKHEFVLDEEIGLRCRVCFLVQQDIKNVFPSVATESHTRRSSGQCSRREDPTSHQPLPHDIDQKVNLKDSSTVWDTIPGIKSTLFPHQQEAFEFLWKNLAGHLTIKKQRPFPSSSSSLGGCIIAHKPGSGKTRLAITFIQSFLRLHPLSLAVVVVPKSVLSTWDNEFRKWKVNIRVEVLERSSYASPYVHLQRGVLILSFGVFVRLSDLANRADSLLVVDECHTARNERSLLWHALNQAQTMNRVLLSGTLFQNNLDELKSTLCLARPGFDWPAGMKDTHLHQLRETMRAFVHVYGGGTTALPPLKDTLLVLDPSPVQRELIKAVEEEASGRILSFQHRSSLAAVHPSLGGSGTALDAAQGVKTRFVTELVKRCKRLNEKVLIFGQFLKPLELLGRQLEELFKWEEGREVLSMNGEHGAAQREGIMERFNDEGGLVRVLLASTKACSEGISLIGASRVVLLDVVWNPAVEWQAISRAYRFGQRRAVYVYRLVAEEAGEWKKHVRQVQKNCMARLVMSLEDGGDGRNGARVNDVDDILLKEMMENDELKDMFKKVICDPMESRT